jgi:hypothetical protein
MKLDLQDFLVRRGFQPAGGWFRGRRSALAASCVSVCLLGWGTGVARADEPLLIFDPLPQPLKLPPGLTETLPLNHEGSYFGDALRAVDCADGVTPAFAGDTIADEVRFGTCGNQFFGGVVMTDSHLTGSVTIQFFPTGPTTAHFVVSQGVMKGDDSVLSAPLGYSLPVKSNQVSDALTLSSGDLDLTTGYAINVLWYAYFSNTALLALGNVNPNLTAPVIAFPGIRGHTWASFSQRPDGLLDFYFRGSTFLALGNDTLGDPVRFPLPFCSADGNCASILARGTSLHPHLYLDTRDSLGLTPCLFLCPDIPTNTTEVFTINTRYTSYGDDFDLRIPEQGGEGPGRSELQGRLEIQFGPQTGNTVPFKVSTMVPEGLFADPPNNPLLGSGFRGFLLGTNQQLHFPLQLYNQHKLSFVDEPYNFAQGMIDVSSGTVLGQFEYPMYIDQTIIEQLIPDNNGRVSTDPFFLVAMWPPQDPADLNYAFFEKEPNGQTMFRANLFHHRSFATYCYPQPAFIPGLCWVSPAGGNLNIFGKLQAAHLPDPANPGAAKMSDSETFTSSVGDVFSYNFSAPCNAVGQPFSFTYTNNNTGASGGTFTMTHPASVSCTNSKVSTAAPGAYDQVAITGFGNWSKDPSGALPRFMSASISIDPANRYAAIIVYQRYPGEAETLPLAFNLPGDDIAVVLSAAENKPPTKPVP